MLSNCETTINFPLEPSKNNLKKKKKKHLATTSSFIAERLEETEILYSH